MRAFKFILPLLIVIAAFAGCHNTGIGGDPYAEPTPVTDIVIKNGSAVISNNSVISLTLGDMPTILTTRVQERSAIK